MTNIQKIVSRINMLAEKMYLAKSDIVKAQLLEQINFFSKLVRDLSISEIESMQKLDDIFADYDEENNELDDASEYED